MKKVLFFAAVAAVAVLSSCAGTYKKGDRMPETTSADVDTVSYALGMYYGKMITSSPFGELNLSVLNKAFNDVLNGRETMLDEDQTMMVIQSYLMKRQTYEAQKNLEEGEAFLLENKEKEGVVELESGLQYKIVREGTGVTPAEKDTVEVNYEGRLLDGTVFDSSYERGESTTFPLNRVIKGWTEGLQHLTEGGEIELYIPANLAYGARPQGSIPGNSTLVFKVELIKVSKYVESEDKGKETPKKINIGKLPTK